MPYVALSAAASRLKRLLGDLPLPDELVPEAEALIKQCTEAELAALGLGPPPRPTVPRALNDSGASGGKDGKPAGAAGAANPQQRLHAVQQVINSLQYNHTPGYYYNVSKSRPFSRVMETAREVLRAALPIKCLEAVFLGALLTAGWHDLDRLPLAFKSTVQGQTYRHIVLVVFHAPSRKWGALGLSRRPELMYKDLVYESLADLVSDYKAAYERWWHALVRVYVGLPLEHDTYYPGPVCWRYLTLSLTGRKPWLLHRETLDGFAGQARRLAAKFRALGVVPGQHAGGGGGGTESGQQGQGGAAATALAHGDPRGRSASGAAGGGAAIGAGAAAGAMRYAKSVSPSRRRRALPPSLLSSTMPLSQRPPTPTRQRLHPARTAAPDRPATAAGVGTSQSGGGGFSIEKSAAPAVRPASEGSGGVAGIGGGSGGGGGGGGKAAVPGREGSGGGGGGRCGGQATADGGGSPAAPTRSAVAGSSDAAAGSGDGSVPDGGAQDVALGNANAASGAGLSAESCLAIRAATETATASGGDDTGAALLATAGSGPGRPEGRSRGAAAAVNPHGTPEHAPAAHPHPDQRRQSGGGRARAGRLARRSSDPGGGAAALAAAAAAAAASHRAHMNVNTNVGTGCRAQARRLRQQVREEEERGGELAAAVAPGAACGERCGADGQESSCAAGSGGLQDGAGGAARPENGHEEEVDEEEEESDSDEGEYGSGGSGSELGD